MKLSKAIFVFFIIFSVSILLNCGGSSGSKEDTDDPPSVSNPGPVEPDPEPIEPEPLPDPTNPIKTVMVYLDADNNLEAAGIADINEMEAVDLSGTDLKIIVLFDRTPGYDTSNGDWTGTRLYEITYDSDGVDGTIDSTRLSSDELGLSSTGDSDELNMGDPDTLSDFISFCKNNYDGNYALILWNHGGGWRDRVNEIANGGYTSDTTIGGLSLDQASFGQVEDSSNSQRGVCWDNTNGNDNLYMDEVQDAVENKGMTVIGFDACLMGMLEVAYEIRNHASYMIASEESEPGDGWEYNYWLASFIATANMNAVDLCNSIIDAYETRYSSTSDTTLSAVDLSEIDNVFDALNSFATALHDSITTDTARDDVRARIANNVEQYNYSGPGSEIFVDLWHMADEIQSQYSYCDTEAAALKTAVDSAVIAEWSHAGRPDSHGLSIDFCYINSSGYYSMLTAYCYNNTEGYPVDFVQNSANKWVVTYDGGSPAGPGLLYRLIFEPL